MFQDLQIVTKDTTEIKYYSFIQTINSNNYYYYE